MVIAKKRIIISIALLAFALGVLTLASGCTTEVKPVASNEQSESEGAVISRPEEVTSPSEALKLLEEGNERFSSDEPASKDLGATKREALVKGQKPFAIILSCSDSRVPPEAIFDQGLGDLFVVRVAGNVDDTVTLGSIEYAAEHLHVPLLVVLGHSGCGAVKATVEGGEIPPNIAAIAGKIEPAVTTAKAANSDEEKIVEAAVVENVKNVIKDIEANSSIVEELIESKKFEVVGATYHLDDGKVEFMEAAEK